MLRVTAPYYREAMIIDSKNKEEKNRKKKKKLRQSLQLYARFFFTFAIDLQFKFRMSYSEYPSK